MIRSTCEPRLRAAALLVAAAALFLLPPVAAGKVSVTIAGGDVSQREGDPVDSNDYGGGGGSDDAVQDSYFVQPVLPRGPGLVLGRWLVLLVPDRSLGITVFSFVAIERTTRDGEGWDAQ
ncbi:MAG: hypothetical protein IH621_12980 [Krumholzibacteria bacterium]|nr:hypothetical protein [Candidatus Krumholzibacteria bacterium]